MIAYIKLSVLLEAELPSGSERIARSQSPRAPPPARSFKAREQQHYKEPE